MGGFSSFGILLYIYLSAQKSKNLPWIIFILLMHVLVPCDQRTEKYRFFLQIMLELIVFVLPVLSGWPCVLKTPCPRSVVSKETDTVLNLTPRWRILDETVDAFEILQVWRAIILKSQCEHQGSFDTSDTKEKRIEAEKEEIGDEAWLRGNILKVDNGVTTLLDKDGYQVTMTMTMMMMMNGIYTTYWMRAFIWWQNLPY